MSQSPPEADPGADPADTRDPGADGLTRFVIERADVRGVLVRLEQSWEQIRGTGHYPDEVAARLGETTAAAAMFAGHAKLDGRLSIQASGTGALRTVFAECTQAGTLRGIAQFTPPLPSPLQPCDFGEGSVLAITIESRAPGASEPVRYQGLVGLDHPSLAAAFEGYFEQSEQLPTRIALVCAGGRAAGLMLQQLPGHQGDSDGWRRCSALFDTLRDEELLDTPAHTLLYRLFHEDGVAVVATKALRFACSCSRDRVLGMFSSLGREEALAAAAETGSAEVTCEFCNTRYSVGQGELEQLFALPSAAPPSGRLH